MTQRELQSRVHKHNSVVRFFTTRAWMRAPRQEACQAVPWARTCRIARALYEQHNTALKRYQRLLFRTLPATNDWVTAAKIVQRVSPGSFNWLMTCSGAEGGHGKWVRFGGHPYYPGYEHTGEVGNWLQYRWPTFKGHYRRALQDARAKGFIVNLPAPEDVAAWRDPLAVALAGGWAILHGQRSHWFASIGNGC